jgi:hypothetical protein
MFFSAGFTPAMAAGVTESFEILAALKVLEDWEVASN